MPKDYLPGGVFEQGSVGTDGWEQSLTPALPDRRPRVHAQVS